MAVIALWEVAPAFFRSSRMAWPTNRRFPTPWWRKSDFGLSRPIVTRQLRPSLEKRCLAEPLSLDWSDQTLAFPACLFSWYYFYNYRFGANQVSPRVKLCQAGDRRNIQLIPFQWELDTRPISPCALGSRLIREWVVRLIDRKNCFMEEMLEWSLWCVLRSVQVEWAKCFLAKEAF